MENRVFINEVGLNWKHCILMTLRRIIFIHINYKLQIILLKLKKVSYPYGLKNDEAIVEVKICLYKNIN